MQPYANEHVTVSVEGGVHLLRQTWVGLPTTESYQEGSLASLALAERHQIKRWLIDLRQLRMFNPLDLQWLTHDLLPEAIFQLPRSPQIAIVLHNQNQFARLGTDLLLRTIMQHQPDISSRYFLDDAEAREWLISNSGIH